MSTEISTKLQELPHLPKPELLALWQELFAKPAHPRLRRNLMIPILAYHIQERAFCRSSMLRRGAGGKYYLEHIFTQCFYAGDN